MKHSKKKKKKSSSGKKHTIKLPSILSFLSSKDSPHLLPLLIQFNRDTPCTEQAQT